MILAIQVLRYHLLEMDKVNRTLILHPYTLDIPINSIFNGFS